MNDFVKLTWQTATETDNNYFQIERSLNGIKFVSFGRVNSQGNTTSGFSYSFIDSFPQRGNNFYRLRIVELSGRVTLSDTVVVPFSTSTGDGIKIYPTLSSGNVKVELLNSSDALKEIVGTILPGQLHCIIQGMVCSISLIYQTCQMQLI